MQTGKPTINGTANGVVTAHADGYVPGVPPAHFWPNASYQAYLGFEVNFTIVAQDPNRLQRLGFSAVGLPAYARVTSVQGTNPVQIKTYWIPCEGQVDIPKNLLTAQFAISNMYAKYLYQNFVSNISKPTGSPPLRESGRHSQKSAHHSICCISNMHVNCLWG